MRRIRVDTGLTKQFNIIRCRTLTQNKALLSDVSLTLLHAWLCKLLLL